MFHLNQNVTWLGYSATVIGKTYGGDRVYAIKLDNGTRYAEVPERQLEPVDNVVALEGRRGQPGRDEVRQAG